MDKVDYQKYFEDNRYVVVRNYLDSTLCGLLNDYLDKKALSLEMQYTVAPESLDPEYNGLPPGGDKQVPSSYAWYGDPMMDTLLEQSTSQVGELINKQLYPTYSYSRLYIKGAELVKHKDRNSCQYSTTICLGGDPWPIFFTDKNNVEVRVDLSPGDMIIYAGCELEHWREPFTGDQCAQVFLHYGDEDNPIADLFDGRVWAGVPHSINKSDLEEQVSDLQERSKSLQKIIDSMESNKHG